jgi:hypothetical protein
VVDNVAALDYYAVLQVDPTADPEIIEAAYRQLMKKHHPDVAGLDLRLAAHHHQRAKRINQAHSVLRDPIQRRKYDAGRFGGKPPATPPSGGSETDSTGARVANQAPSTAWAPSQAPEAWARAEASEINSAVRGPFAALAAAYYLLPGTYEWERGHGGELLRTCLLPPVGVAAFALATGRLVPWLGHSIGATLLAWGIVLILILPSWSSLPRLALAGLPSVLLMSGYADVALRQASIPSWLAWVLLGFLSLVLSARMYVFAVLPTLGACWLLTRLG